MWCCHPSSARTEPGTRVGPWMVRASKRALRDRAAMATQHVASKKRAAGGVRCHETRQRPCLLGGMAAGLPSPCRDRRPGRVAAPGLQQSICGAQSGQCSSSIWACSISVQVTAWPLCHQWGLPCCKPCPASLLAAPCCMILGSTALSSRHQLMHQARTQPNITLAIPRQAHEATPLRVRQLLLGKLGKGAFRR